MSMFCLFVQYIDANKIIRSGNDVDAIKRGVGSSNNITYTTTSGVQRTMLLHIPTNYDIDLPTPLMFSFHGHGRNGSWHENLTQFSNELFNPDMFVVYPNGINEIWQGDPNATDYDDISFVLELMKSFEDEFCIDKSRIYSSGQSNGGGFTLDQLACNATASNKFAAFMGGSAAAYQGTSNISCDPATVPIPCSPGRPFIPILEIHGTNDTTIAYYGGPRKNHCLPTIPHFVTEWAERDGLGGSNISTSLDGGNVTKYEFGASTHAIGPYNATGLVTHYRVEGLGHMWPWENQGHYINATSITMAFFNTYTLDWSFL
ncbi:putative ferulic acid esterase [Delphinella strobiligena]|nr:putative ferulic acid esterase [Delphinella strobiligena]